MATEQLDFFQLNLSQADEYARLTIAMNDSRGRQISHDDGQPKTKNILFLISRATEALATYLDTDFAILGFSAPYQEEEKQEMLKSEQQTCNKVKSEQEPAELMKDFEELKSNHHVLLRECEEHKRNNEA